MSDLVPSSDLLPRLHEEFGRIAQRPVTQLEGRMLEFFAARVSPGSRARWVDCLLPESVVQLALAAGSAGMSALLVSPFPAESEARQLRLGTRGPLLPLRAAIRKAGGSRGLAAWCSPSELSGALLTRVFGAAGPDVLVVEQAQAATGLGGLFRPSLAAAGSVLRRFEAARILASAPASSPTIRSAVAESWKLPELTAVENHDVEHQLLFASGLRIQAAAVSTSLEEPDWLERVTALPRPAVLLCASVAEADAVYARCADAGLPVHRFHAALPETERAKELVHFSLPGRRAMLVAVSGFAPGSGFAGESSQSFPSEFGQGYVRQDLRSIVHMSAPSSLSQYLQELSWLAPDAGAAEQPAFSEESEEEDSSYGGHLDASPPQSLLFVSDRQFLSHQQLLANKRTAPVMLEAALDAFRAAAVAADGPRPGIRWGAASSSRELRAFTPGARTPDAQTLSRAAWTEQLLCSAQETERLAAFLEDAGIVRRVETEPPAPSVGSEEWSPEWELAVSWAEAERRLQPLLVQLELLRESDAERIAEMQAFLSGQQCRRQALAQLLLGGSPGSTPEDEVLPSQANTPCGVCDACESLSAAIPMRTTPARQQGAVEARSRGDAPVEKVERPSLRAVPAPCPATPARKARHQRRISSTSEPPRKIQDAPTRPGLAKARHK